MFLRWTRYQDKVGMVRLYARLVCSRREGRRVHQRSVGSLYVRLAEGREWSAQERSDVWRHLDYVLRRHRPSDAERARIERAFAAKVGPRPKPGPLEKLLAAVARAEKAAVECG